MPITATGQAFTLNNLDTLAVELGDGHDGGQEDCLAPNAPRVPIPRTDVLDAARHIHNTRARAYHKKNFCRSEALQTPQPLETLVGTGVDQIGFIGSVCQRQSWCEQPKLLCPRGSYHEVRDFDSFKRLSVLEEGLEDLYIETGFTPALLYYARVSRYEGANYIHTSKTRPWQNGARNQPWKVTLYDLNNGLNKCLKDYPIIIDRLIDRAWTPVHLNIILQYSVFGEQLFA